MIDRQMNFQIRLQNKFSSIVKWYGWVKLFEVVPVTVCIYGGAIWVTHTAMPTPA